MTESQYRYYYRRKQGLCGHCGGRPAEEGKAECTECLAKHLERTKKHYEENKQKICEKARERNAERRAEAIANGMCSRCYIRPADDGYLTCWRCRANNNTAYRTPKPRDKEKAAERARKRRERLIAEHICISCGKRPADENRQKCAICTARHNKAHRERSWQKGTVPRDMGGDGTYCAICFKPKCQGEKLYPECLEKSRESIKKAKLANGRHGGWVEIRF